ncbi:MAG: hypothetical protein HKN25_13150 [Pyrinomonadaceae bacterium]|nr:hypothetical protein [Pyrinomonadaceae bacterium]
MNKIKNLRTLQLWISLCFIAASATLVSADDQISSFKQWNITGPTGGDVRTIVIDPRNANNLFVSTLDGQVHGSYDGGATWKLLVNLNRPRLILDDLIIDPRDSNVLYTSGHRHKKPGGFFKTIDGGKTWREARELRSEAIHAMVQSSRDPDMILVGSVTGVWVSRDSGDTWTKFTSNTTPIKLDALAIDPKDVDTIYAGTWWRAYKTTDGGKNWRLVKKGMIDDSDVFAIDINQANPDNVIASACSGIYQSFNKGETWKKIQGIPSQSRRTRAIMLNPYKPGAVYAGTTEGFWMSTNGGRSWRLTTSKNLEINSIAVHKSNPDKIYIATNNYGVMVSNNGGRTFGSNNGNFTSRFTYNIVPDIERPNRLYATTINTATGGGFVFISNDFGRTWSPAVRNIDTKRTITYALAQDRVDPNRLFIGTNYGIYLSLDRGSTWKRLKPPAPKRKPRRRRRGKRRAPVKQTVLPKGVVAAVSTKVNTIVPTEDGNNGFYVGTNKGLYRSDDIAKGLKKVDFGPGMNEQVFAVHVSPKAPKTIWAGTAVSGLLVSHDAGATWMKAGMDRAGNQIIPDRVPISTIVTKPDNPGHVLVGTIQTLYMSRDFGKTWVRRGGNLPLGNYNSILFNPKNNEEVFVASALESNGGIFRSTDGGYMWSRIDSKSFKLASHQIWSLMFNPVNPNEIFAGTHSSGIYRIERTFEARVETPAAEEKTSTEGAITRTRVASTP